MRLVYSARTNGRQYRVYQNGWLWHVRVGDEQCVQSVLAPPGQLTGFYYDEMAQALRHCGSVAVLGNGAGSIARILRGWNPGMRIVGVEPDREMNRIARKLGVLSYCTNLKETTAEEFLVGCDMEGIRFDGVAVDVYDADVPAPETEAIVRAARYVLNPSGILTVNRWTPETGNRISVERMTAAAPAGLAPAVAGDGGQNRGD